MLRIGGKGFADFNRLTDEEKTRFVFTMSRYIGNVYNGILLHQQGLLDRETLDEIGGLVATAVHSPGGAVWWASWPHPEPVKKYVDEIIARGEFPSVDVAAPYWLTAWEWPESSDR